MFHSMFPHLYSLCSSLLLHIYYIPRPSHPPCVKQHFNIRWTVQTVKLLFVQFSQGCCSSFLSCQNISLHPVLKHLYHCLCLSLNVSGHIPVMFVSVFPLPRCFDLGLQIFKIICVIKNYSVDSWTHGKWVPMTMAWCILRLQMEEQLPIWRVDANVLNKHSQTADKGWSSSLGVQRSANSLP
jgi:hypothetical protein